MLLFVCRNVVITVVTRRTQCFPQFELPIPLKVKDQFMFQSSPLIFLADNRQKHRVSLENIFQVQSNLSNTDTEGSVLVSCSYKRGHYDVTFMTPLTVLEGSLPKIRDKKYFSFIFCR